MIRRALIAINIVLLGACGGGGDKGGVTTPTAVTAINMSVGSRSVEGLGTDFTITVTLSPSGATATVTWTTDNPAVATVTGNGLSATVHAVGAGSTRIVAHVGAIEGVTNVTVVPIVRGISFTSDTVRMTVGATQSLSPTIQADAGANQSLNWSSGTPGVAQVSGTGVVTALAPGVSVITATLTAFPSISASIPVLVSAPAVSITVSPQNPTVFTGATRQLTADVTAGAGVPTTVNWSTSAGGIATVSSTGLVTGVSPGQATITATSTVNPGATATTLVTVANPVLRAITLAPTPTTVAVGGTRTLVPTFDADAGANTALTWSTSASAIAAVSGTGVVTGIAPGGPVTITARSVANANIFATAQVTVTPPPASTQFAAANFGVSPFLSGWAFPVLASINSNNVVAGFSVQGGGLGTFANNLLHMRNGTWSDVTPACCGTAGLVNTIAAESPTSAMASWGGDLFSGANSGGPGKVYRYNGTSWLDTQWPTALANEQRMPSAVAAVGNGEYFAVDTKGVLYRYPVGGPWTRIDSLLLPQFASVTGLVAWHHDSVVVSSCPAAAGGTEIRLWGGGVQSLLAPPTPGLNCPRMRGVRADSLIIASFDGLGIWNGTQWRYVAAGLQSTDTLRYVTICGTTRYALSQNQIAYQQQGNTLTRISSDGEAGSIGDFGSTSADISCGLDGTLRVAAGASLVSRRSGSTWIEENYAPSAVAVHLASQDVGFIVGRGIVYRWNGSTWQLLRRTVAARDNYTQVAGQTNGHMIALGTSSVGGTSRVSLFYNGTSFVRTTIDNYFNPRSLVSVGNDQAYAVFASTNQFDSPDVILQFDGANWTPVAGLANEKLVVGASAPNNVIALGTNNFARRFDGTTWATINGLPGVIPAFVHVESGTSAVAAGTCTATGSRIFRFNGTVWTESTFPASLGAAPCVLSLFGTSTDQYALVRGTSGTKLLRWDGAQWIVLDTPDLTTAVMGSAVQGLTVLAESRGRLVVGTPPAAPSPAAIRMRATRRR